MFQKIRFCVLSLLVFTCCFIAAVAAQQSRVNVFVANSGIVGNSTVTHFLFSNQGFRSVNISINPCSAFDQALSIDGKFTYTSCTDNNLVAVVNTATNQVTAGIAGISRPYKMSVCLNGTRLAIPSLVISGSQVYLADTVTNSVVATIDPSGDPLSAGAQYAYTTGCFGSFLVVGFANGFLLTYDLSQNPPKLLAANGQLLNSGYSMQHVAHSSNGTEIYAGLPTSGQFVDENGNLTPVGNVVVLRASTLGIKTTVDLQTFATVNWIIPVGRFMYVSDSDAKLYAVDSSSHALVNTLTIGSSPDSQGMGLALDRSKKLIYAVDGSPTASKLVAIRRGAKPSGDRIVGYFPAGPSSVGVGAR
jgi:YVTN family beta-propeller protein